MRTLVRFEDTYGIWSLLKLFKEIEVCDTSVESVYQVKDTELFIQKGLGITNVFRISKKELVLLDSLKIEKIICVHDLDSASGKDDAILSEDEVLSLVNTTLKRMKSAGVNIDLGFIPVVFNAESILLYGLYNVGRDIIEYKNSVNTKKLHLAIVAGTLNCSMKDCKRYVETCDEKMRNRLQKGFKLELEKNRTNKEIVSWILSRNVEVFEYLSLSDVLNILNKVDKVVPLEMITVEGNEFSVRTLADIMEMYSSLRAGV